MAADEKFLGKLHELQAQYMASLFERVDEEGNPVPVSAAELAQVNTFLAKNNITCSPAKSDALDQLQNKMQERAAKRKRPVITIDDAALAQEQMDYLERGLPN